MESRRRAVADVSEAGGRVLLLCTSGMARSRFPFARGAALSFPAAVHSDRVTAPSTQEQKRAAAWRARPRVPKSSKRRTKPQGRTDASSSRDATAPRRYSELSLTRSGSIKHRREPRPARLVVGAQRHQVHRLQRAQPLGQAPVEERRAQGDEDREGIVRNRRNSAQ